jgi:hypothetical protein
VSAAACGLGEFTEDTSGYAAIIIISNTPPLSSYFKIVNFLPELLKGQ